MNDIVSSSNSVNQFYQIFRDFVKKSSFDFTMTASNQKLFDDSDDEMGKRYIFFI